MNRIIQLSVGIALCGAFLYSCKKDGQSGERNDTDLNHYEIIRDKILAQDKTAFVGEWETISTVTWDTNDNSQTDSSKGLLTITDTYWITEGGQIPYTLEYSVVCNAIHTSVTFHQNGEDINAHFMEFGWEDQMRFRTYEYPDDSDIFRLDRIYSPIDASN